MTTITTASQQWAKRPDDERFTSLTAMLEHFGSLRARSQQHVLTNRAIQVHPVQGDALGLAVSTDAGAFLPTNWAFGQLAERAGAPASYLRTLAAPLAADCLNYGIRRRDVAELGTLTRGAGPGAPVAELAAVTGPAYGRAWNHDVVEALVNRFGDGVTGEFRVPGEWGNAVDVTQRNTTLYASDRDMFVFLADEERRIEMPDRRDGKPGALARGFFVWNSEVGSSILGVATFLFDYVCGNRIVWGAEGYKEIRLRHTAGAPMRWIEEVAPALVAYSQSSTLGITDALLQAKADRLDDIESFLADRFTTGQAKAIKLAFETDEDRPMETRWDVVTGITAYARGIPHQDRRVEIERAAGKLLA